MSPYFFYLDIVWRLFWRTGWLAQLIGYNLTIIVLEIPVLVISNLLSATPVLSQFISFVHKLLPFFPQHDYSHSVWKCSGSSPLHPWREGRVMAGNVRLFFSPLPLLHFHRHSTYWQGNVWNRWLRWQTKKAHNLFISDSRFIFPHSREAWLWAPNAWASFPLLFIHSSHVFCPT